MEKNEHAQELAKRKKGMKYKPSEARLEANRKNWQKAMEAIKRRSKNDTTGKTMATLAR